MFPKSNLKPIKDVLDVLIKIYRPNQNINFPNGGKLTPYLENLSVGDKVHVEGPFGKFHYESNGNITIGSELII
jgi:NAD(P)H-flavin reductase